MELLVAAAVCTAVFVALCLLIEYTKDGNMIYLLSLPFRILLIPVFFVRILRRTLRSLRVAPRHGQIWRTPRGDLYVHGLNKEGRVALSTFRPCDMGPNGSLFSDSVDEWRSRVRRGKAWFADEYWERNY
jgi:hypothetical protein